MRQLIRRRERMNKIFGHDTFFFRFMNQAGNVIIATLLWLLGCLPVVTIGTSTIALYYTTVKSIRRGEGYVSWEFFGAYRRNLKNGILMTVVFLLLGVVLAIDRMYVDQGQSAAAAAFSLGYTLLTLVVVSMAVYVFPVMSRFTMSAWECFRLALLMVFRHLPFTVILLGMAIGTVCLVLLIPAPMLFILPGACCYGQSFLMERLLKKYMAKPQTGEEAEKWYYR